MTSDITRALVITVGGSCQPVITAARDFDPIFTCFLVSTGERGSRLTVDGTGKPCINFQDKSLNQPNIVSQLAWGPERYTVEEIDDPDSLNDCYAAARKALSIVLERMPSVDVVADFTGGTKSMSVGLALAALEANVQISLVKGTRSDLVRVADGSEVAGLINAWDVRARQQVREAIRLFNKFEYATTETLLESILRSSPVSNELQRTIRSLILYARIFDAWDRFDHERARALLKNARSNATKPLLAWLALLTGENKTATGFEIVADLVLNAERKANSRRYDDAVARLYRATELIAQVQLQRRNPALSTSDIDVSKLPVALRPTYESLRRDGKIKIGLLESYQLLHSLDDSIGHLFYEVEKKMKALLLKRNESILAHGLQPLTQDDYYELKATVYQFLYRVQPNLKAPQFPQFGVDEIKTPELIKFDTVK